MQTTGEIQVLKADDRTPGCVCVCWGPAQLVGLAAGELGRGPVRFLWLKLESVSEESR